MTDAACLARGDRHAIIAFPKKAKQPVTVYRPMAARIIDGKTIASQLRREIAQQVAEGIAAGRRVPGLAVIMLYGGMGLEPEALASALQSQGDFACDRLRFLTVGMTRMHNWGPT